MPERQISSAELRKNTAEYYDGILRGRSHLKDLVNYYNSKISEIETMLDGGCIPSTSIIKVAKDQKNFNNKTKAERLILQKSEYEYKLQNYLCELKKIDELIEMLDPEDQELIRLRYIDKLSHDRIAKKCNMSCGETVRRTINNVLANTINTAEWRRGE